MCSFSQPLSSVTVTLYEPANTPILVNLFPGIDIGESDPQVTLYGDVPPIIVNSTSPFALPLHDGSTIFSVTVIASGCDIVIELEV